MKSNIRIDTLITGPVSANTYIVYGLCNNECAVIDPADSLLVQKHLDEHKLKCTHILITHGHFDHILGVAQLKRMTNALICIHKDDAQCLNSDKLNLAAFVGAKVEACNADVEFVNGATIEAAGAVFNVLHTPGHSPGSVCYVLNEHGVVFSGDTLFRLSVGRTDLYGSSEEDLIHSITYKLYRLNVCADYRVLPGHMRETTLNFEREHNPCVRELS